MNNMPKPIEERLSALRRAYYDRVEDNEFTKEYFTKALMIELYGREQDRLWGVSLDDMIHEIENSAINIVKICKEDKDVTIEEMLDIVAEDYPATIKCLRAMYRLEDLQKFMEEV